MVVIVIFYLLDPLRVSTKGMFMNHCYKLLLVASLGLVGNALCMEDRNAPQRSGMTPQQAGQNLRSIWLGVLGITNQNATRSDVDRVYYAGRMNASSQAQADRAVLAYGQLMDLIPEEQQQPVNPNLAVRAVSLALPSATALVPTQSMTQQVSVQQPTRVVISRRTYPDGRQTIVRRRIRSQSVVTHGTSSGQVVRLPDTHPNFNPHQN